MTSAQPPVHQQVHPRARVLLLVADRKERERVLAVLRQDGHDVLPAASGRDAAVVLCSRMQRPTVAVVDMRLPISDGTAFATAYRTAPAPHPPIVLVSAPGAAVAAASATAAATGADVDPAYGPAALALIRSRVRLIAQEAPLLDVRIRTRARSLLAAAALAAVLGIGALPAFAPAGSAATQPPSLPAPEAKG